MSDQTAPPDDVQPGPVPTAFAVAAVSNGTGESMVLLRVTTPMGAGFYFLEPEDGDHETGGGAVREDFIDYPTGWELQRAGLQHVTLACSAVPPEQGGSPLGGPALLCDCAALPYAWVDRCVAQRVSRGEDAAEARADQMRRAAGYLGESAHA